MILPDHVNLELLALNLIDEIQQMLENCSGAPTKLAVETAV